MGSDRGGGAMMAAGTDAAVGGAASPFMAACLQTILN